MRINANAMTGSAYKQLQQTGMKTTTEHRASNPVERSNALDGKGEDAALQELDSVEITPENERENPGIKDKLQQMRDDWRDFKNQLDNSIEQSDGAAKYWKIRIQCLQIAMRIMKGDNVPIEDERFLAKNDMELYTKAVSLRMPKEDPHDYDRLSEDEEDDNSGVSGDIESPEPLQPENEEP